MRSKLLGLAVVAVTVGGALATVASGASGGRTLTCVLDNRSQSPANSTTGYDLGKIRCGSPLHSGLEYDQFKDTVSGSHVTITGRFKLYFDTGTTHGTYRISGSATGTTFTGTVKTTGGTGAFSHVSGPGTISCTPSSSTADHCTITSKLNGI